MANTPVSVRLDENILKFVDAEAARRKWSRNAVIQTCVEYSLPDLEREPVGSISKKIADVSVAGGAQESGGTPDLPRGGKAQDMPWVGGNRDLDPFNSEDVSAWKERDRQAVEMLDKNSAGQDGMEYMYGFSTSEVPPGTEIVIPSGAAAVRLDEGWVGTGINRAEIGLKPRSQGLSRTVIGQVSSFSQEEQDVEFSEENPEFAAAQDKNKSEGLDGVEGRSGKELVEDCFREKGSATGKNRRPAAADQKDDHGGKGPSVGVGKPGVDMEALRDICAGKFPLDAKTRMESIEVDLCGFKSYNEIDGEWYVCGKEVHGPKVKHGDWIKV